MPLDLILAEVAHDHHHHHDHDPTFFVDGNSSSSHHATTHPTNFMGMTPYQWEQSINSSAMIFKQQIPQTVENLKPPIVQIPQNLQLWKWWQCALKTLKKIEQDPTQCIPLLPLGLPGMFNTLMKDCDASAANDAAAAGSVLFIQVSTRLCFSQTFVYSWL